jgi:hypothetical protein
MILHCPCCHAHYSIEALTQDAAARELLGMRATMPPNLLSYLTLFRSETRALSFDRALKLAKETLQLSDNTVQLDAAMAETVESMRAKREQGVLGKPLKNHNYLKRVLESTPESGSTAVATRQRTSTVASKRAQSFEHLAIWAGGEWVREAISVGLQALVALSLENTPAADTICRTADIWYHVLTKHNALDIEEIDSPRVASAFSALLSKTGGKWPEPKTLKDLLPKRPQRQALDHVETEEVRARGMEAARALTALVGGAK